MSDDRIFERAARSWLETGPTEAPDRVVENALLTIATTPQERDLRISRRLPFMNSMPRVAAVLAVVALALGVTVVTLRPNTPSVVGAAGGAPSARPSASQPPDLIPDGTYVGPSIPVAEIVAYVNADSKLTAAQKTALIKQSFAIDREKTFSATLEFNAGRYTQSQTLDSRTDVGSGGTYSFAGDMLVVHEACAACGLTGYTVTPTSNGFTLKLVGEPPTEADAVAVKFIFEHGPFTRVP